MDGYAEIQVGDGKGSISSGMLGDRPAVFIGSSATKPDDIILCFETKERAFFVAEAIAGTITEKHVHYDHEGKPMTAVEFMLDHWQDPKPQPQPEPEVQPEAPSGGTPLTEILRAQVHIGVLKGIADALYDHEQEGQAQALQQISSWLQKRYPA
jgi:hypothetical protein